VKLVELGSAEFEDSDAPSGDFHQAAGKGSQYNPEAEPGAYR